ncbi:MAG TPA: DUF4382 domain-containing protein [Longimicrobium sp.]|jgi:hypothetical protein|uniref:DUF4382 domain-containing protein n=1 Tax=Longimicrobium sp. TaxID=2029185 RepID=UPI002ED9012E
MKKTTLSLTAAALALFLAACDNPAGSDSNVQVLARGDDATAGSQSVAEADGPRYSHSTAQGTIDFQARVYVYSSTSGWLEVTEASRAAGSVAASGHGEAQTVARGRVEAGSYSRVRVIFEDVDANLSGSLAVSTGLLSGSVAVNLESDGQVVVERDANVTVSADATSRILINLNADAWLNSANAQTRTVSEAAFRSAVRVTAE